MVSEKITVGLSINDLDVLSNFLSGKGLECTLCSKVGDKGARYFVLGPMDKSYNGELKKLAESYEVLGPGEGNLDQIKNYFKEHDCDKKVKFP